MNQNLQKIEQKLIDIHSAKLSLKLTWSGVVKYTSLSVNNQVAEDKLNAEKWFCH